MSKHFLEDPKIPRIPAKDLFIDPKDLELDQQRHPEDRRRELIKAYGEHGEKFSLEHCGALKVKPAVRAPDGKRKYPIKDGGGRWWAVMNLLKMPNLKLPCVVMERTSDLEAFIVAQESVRVPSGKIFMARGNDIKNDYEHRVCNILKDLGLTTNPGKGRKTINVNHAMFGFDLGVLRTALQMASQYWGQGKGKIEGLAIAGLVGFLFIYKNTDGFDIDRVHHILKKIPYDDLKERAREFLPKNKEHGRQWGNAMAKELVIEYNLGVSKVRRLNLDDLSRMQEKLQGHEHFPVFRSVWEFRKVIKTQKHRPTLNVASSR